MLGLNTEILRDSYNSWGPSARDCLRFAKNPKAIDRHEQDVFQTVSELTKDASRFTDFQVPSAMHQIFVVRPSPDSREIATVEFGTNRLRDIVARAYAQRDHALQYSFYRTIREHPYFASPARQMFEIRQLLWFRHYYSNPRSCTGAAESSPPLQIPCWYNNLKFFYKVEELKDISQTKTPICLVPTSPKFPALSAIVLTGNAVITIQITIALKHGAKEQEFDLIYKNLPPDLLAKRPGRCHVFITDNEMNARSLREQNQTQVPNGTLVYSMAFGIKELESWAPATEELVDALEKARVSIYLLRAMWYLSGNVQSPPSEETVTDD